MKYDMEWSYETGIAKMVHIKKEDAKNMQQKTCGIDLAA